jgi:hypothetical protein
LLKLSSSCQPLLEPLLMFLIKAVESHKQKMFLSTRETILLSFKKGRNIFFRFFYLVWSKSAEISRALSCQQRIHFSSGLSRSNANKNNINNIKKTSCTVATKKERKKKIWAELSTVKYQLNVIKFFCRDQHLWYKTSSKDCASNVGFLGQNNSCNCEFFKACNKNHTLRYETITNLVCVTSVCRKVWKLK